MRTVKNIPGDFAEFGVDKGDMFLRIVTEARHQGRIVHAFDSFVGFDDPTEWDADPNGSQHYRKGDMNHGGAAELLSRLSGFDNYTVWEGYIPGVLDKVPADCRFAFAHVDLDHYAPTQAVLHWLLERMGQGAVIHCHDYISGLKQCATLAINQFLVSAKGRVKVVGIHQDSITLERVFK